MKLEQIRYLLEISRLRSISAASRSLHVGQTTLSAIVKATEEEVGFPIFQRSPNGVTATPMGDRFMALAWEIDIKYEELLALKRRVTSGSAVVTALMSPSAAFCLAIPLAERFYRNELHGSLSFEEYPSGLIGDRILDNTANIGIAYLSEQDIHRLEKSTDKDRLKVERLLEDEMMLLVSKNHRFADREFVNAEEICAERVGAAQKIRNDKILGNLILRCDRMTSFSSVDLVCKAVREQEMVAFVSKFISEHSSAADLTGLKTIPIRNTEHENKDTICLLTCKERNLRYPEKVLKNCIVEYFSDLKNGVLKTDLPECGGEES